jgi:hypothetical protein
VRAQQDRAFGGDGDDRQVVRQVGERHYDCLVCHFVFSMSIRV